MGQSTKPRGKRNHTPVWEVLWSVRPQLKGFIPDVSPGETAAEKAPTPAAHPAGQPAPDTTARPAVWWVKQVGKDMALVPLKLLHLLLVGYEPQAQRPQIRYRRPT